MFDTLLEVLPEVLLELLYPVAAAVLAVMGILTEIGGYENVTAGDSTLGVWMLVMGAVMLYAAVSITYEKALPAMRSA